MQEQTPRDLRKLAPDVPRDLAMIVHRAIDRDRERRYPSAIALAEDLRRFQQGRAVSARPPHAWYLLRKSLRRNPLASFLSAALLLAMVSFSMYTWNQAQDLRAEKDLAREALAYLTEDVLPLLDPSLKGSMSTMSEVLREASASVGERFHAQPALEREVRLALAMVQLQHGHPVGARENLVLAKALDLPWTSAQQQGEYLLLEAEAALNTADLPGAQQAMASLLDLNQNDAWPADFPTRRARIQAHLLAEEGQADLGVELLQQLGANLAQQQDVEGEWRTRLWQVPLLRQKGQTDEAAALAEQVVAQALSMHPQRPHLEVAQAQRELGWSLFHAGKIQQAEAPLRAALELRTTLLGERHPDVAQSLVDLST